MSYYEVNFKLNENEFPILKNIKPKDLNDIIFKIFKTGYNIHFPKNDTIEKQIEYNQLIEKMENIKTEISDQIHHSDINTKINSLESNLNELIGLSSNSCKKGNFAENILEETFNKRYGDIQFERKSQVAHSGDAWLHLPDGKIIMLESKNYNTTVNKDEINKLQSDMINHHIKWGILVSFNSMIQGMKELDFHTFTHNNETYYVIMISSLSSDIHKLDLGLQITRKLINNFDNIDEFPWIVNDINQSLSELNQIVQKNYQLRDSFYNMEKDMQKLLSNYHVTLRDYQYDLEQKINTLIDKIKASVKKSKNNKIKIPTFSFQNILDKYQNKKILPIIVRIIDVAQHKKWDINFDNENNQWIFTSKNIEICRFKILNNKVIINIHSNDLTLNLNIGKDKENKQNLEIIKSL